MRIALFLRKRDLKIFGPFCPPGWCGPNRILRLQVPPLYQVRATQQCSQICAIASYFYRTEVPNSFSYGTLMSNLAYSTPLGLKHHTLVFFSLKIRFQVISKKSYSQFKKKTSVTYLGPRGVEQASFEVRVPYEKLLRYFGPVKMGRHIANLATLLCSPYPKQGGYPKSQDPIRTTPPTRDEGAKSDFSHKRSDSDRNPFRGVLLLGGTFAICHQTFNSSRTTR